MTLGNFLWLFGYPSIVFAVFDAYVTLAVVFLSSFFLKFNRIQNPMFFFASGFPFFFWLDAMLFLLSFSVNNHLKGTHFGISSLDKLCTPILAREQKYLVIRSIEWHTIILINGCSVFTQARRTVIARFKFIFQSKQQIKVLIKC